MASVYAHTLSIPNKLDNISIDKNLVFQVNYLLDSCKSVFNDNRTRMFTHNKEFVTQLLPIALSNYYRRTGKYIDNMEEHIEAIGIEHIKEDYRYKFIPYAKSYVAFKEQPYICGYHYYYIERSELRKYIDKWLKGVKHISIDENMDAYIEKVLDGLYFETIDAENYWLTFNLWYLYTIMPLYVEDQYFRINMYDMIKYSIGLYCKHHNINKNIVLYSPYELCEITNLEKWMNNGIGAPNRQFDDLRQYATTK